jgi:hypothetical protein
MNIYNIFVGWARKVAFSVEGLNLWFREWFRNTQPKIVSPHSNQAKDNYEYSYMLVGLAKEGLKTDSLLTSTV